MVLLIGRGVADRARDEECLLALACASLDLDEGLVDGHRVRERHGRMDACGAKWSEERRVERWRWR